MFYILSKTSKAESKGFDTPNLSAFFQKFVQHHLTYLMV